MIFGIGKHGKICENFRLSDSEVTVTVPRFTFRKEKMRAVASSGFADKQSFFLFPFLY